MVMNAIAAALLPFGVIILTGLTGGRP